MITTVFDAESVTYIAEQDHDALEPELLRAVCGFQRCHGVDITNDTQGSFMDAICY